MSAVDSVLQFRNGTSYRTRFRCGQLGENRGLAPNPAVDRLLQFGNGTSYRTTFRFSGPAAGAAQLDLSRGGGR